MYFDTVYYPRFWYSRFLNIRLSSFDGRMDHTALTLHLMHLRLLSLIFPRIYIPRTHLITNAFNQQSDIAIEVFKAEEFSYLIDTGVICVSTLPGLDAQEDNQRISARRSETADVSYSSDRNYLRILPNTRSYAVQSNKESEGNKITFPHYASLMDVVDPELSRTMKDEIERASLRDVPFFHEAFVVGLRKKVGEAQFERVWRDTNSIYLTSPVPSEAGLVSYFDDEIESGAYRFRDGLDRFLISPPAIYMFLCTYLTEAQVSKFLTGPVTSTHHFVLPTGFRAEFAKAFRIEYWRIIREVSGLLAFPGGYRAPGAGELPALFEAVTSSSIRARGAAVAAVANEIRTASDAGAQHGMGLVAGLGSMAVKHGSSWLDRKNRAARYPGITGFIRVLRSDLDLG